MNWAKEEIALLKSLREQRIETKVIAERLGRSTFAISKKIYYLGLETRANRGRKKPKASERATEWADTYTKICDRACTLHESGVSVEIKSRRTPSKQWQFAVFRIYPN